MVEKIEDTKKDHVASIKARLNQRPLKPVIVFKKKTGELVKALYSTKIDELQKTDRRSFDVIELEAGDLPQNIREYLIVNGILKKKPVKILNAEKKAELESRLVILIMQLKVAKESKLEGAIKLFSEAMCEIEYKIKELGAE